MNQRRIYSDNDFKLLAKELPANPCDTCKTGVNAGCGGCPDSMDYKRSLKEYVDAGIMQEADIIRQYRTLERAVSGAISEMHVLSDRLYAAFGVDTPRLNLKRFIPLVDSSPTDTTSVFAESTQECMTTPRYIDANALMEALDENVLNDPNCPMFIAATVDQYIAEAPTVDIHNEK